MAQAIAKVGQAASGIAKGTGGTIGGVLKLLFFVKIKWTLTILLVIYYTMIAGQASIEQKNIFPLVMEIGGKFSSADNQLFWKLKTIEDNEWNLPLKDVEPDEEGGFWRDIKSLGGKFTLALDIFSAGWFVYIMIYIFYWIASRHNTSEYMWNLTVAIIIVILLQSLHGEAMLYLNQDSTEQLSENEKYAKIGLAMTPAKGLYKLVTSLTKDKLFKTFREGAVPYLEPINETNSTAS